MAKIPHARVYKLRVLLFKEGASWIAQCLDHDIVAEGRTIPKVAANFRLTLIGFVALAIDAGREPLADLPRAPPEFWEKYEQGGKLAATEFPKLSVSHVRRVTKRQAPSRAKRKIAIPPAWKIAAAEARVY